MSTNEWYPWDSRDDLQTWMGMMKFDGTPESFMQMTREQDAQYEHQKQLASDAELVVAARHAVEIGDMTNAEAALALRQSGRQAAHDVFVQEWHAAEHADEAEYAAEEFLWADADEYLQRTGQLDDAAAVKATADETAAQAAEATKLAEQIRSKLDATVPEGHPLRTGIEAAIVLRLNEDGGAPSDDAGQAQIVRAAIQKAGVLDNAAESIRQQADQEWRILRKTHGKSDGLTTAADIEAARAHYINARLQQLGDRKLIAHGDLEAPPTAEDEKQKYIDRIDVRNSQSTSLHTTVGEIEARAREAEAARRAGASTYGSGSEKERYRESVRRAEENARVGAAPEAQADATATAVVSRNPDRPDIPPDWPDEFGPVL